MARDGSKDIVMSFEEYKLPPVGHAIAGALGSTMANLLIYPLDISTTRLQLESNEKNISVWETVATIFKSEGGLKGLYAGLGADTVATVLSSFVYFYCYTFLRNTQEKLNVRLSKPAQLNIAQELFLGAEAALISRLFTTPVANVTTRLQTAGTKTKGMLQTARDIHQEKGVRGFWTGYRASIALVSNPSITYFVFEKLKALHLRSHKTSPSLSPFKVFLFSASAKTVATMLTYPFIFARANLIGRKAGEKEKKLGMVALMKNVVRKEGPAGLYKGMQAQVIKGFFNQGIMYMIKDYVSAYLALLFYMRYKWQKRLA